MSKDNSLIHRPIFPDTFLRIFEKKLSKTTSWNVNTQLWKDGDFVNVIKDCFPQTFFYAKETHVSFIKTKHRNTASTTMCEVLNKLYQMFKRSEYKYTLFIQFDDFSMERINVGVDLDLLESKTRKGEWWRLIFSNQGLRSERKYKNSNEEKENGKQPKKRKNQTKEDFENCKRIKLCKSPISPKILKFKKNFEMPNDPISPIPPSPIFSKLSFPG